MRTSGFRRQGCAAEAVREHRAHDVGSLVKGGLVFSHGAAGARVAERLQRDGQHGVRNHVVHGVGNPLELYQAWCRLPNLLKRDLICQKRPDMYVKTRPKMSKENRHCIHYPRRHVPSCRCHFPLLVFLGGFALDTDRQTNRQTDRRQTDRQTDRHTQLCSKYIYMYNICREKEKGERERETDTDTHRHTDT